MEQQSADRLPYLAFFTFILFGGLNAIGVRFTVMELSPFWGAVIRFAPASLILFLIALAMRLPLPGGKALLGTVLFGVLNIGVSYSFLYWGLQEVPAGLAQVLLALVPLLTLLFAIAHRQESFRWRAFTGGLLALAGVAIVFGGQARAGVPLLSMLAVLLGAVCIAESGVIVKGFPKTHPITTNAVAMASGTVVLLVASLLGGEAAVLPAQATTWAALVYLVLFGSCAVFILYLYVLKRWTASATSFSFVLFPFVTVVASSIMTGERIGPALIFGAALVLSGVYYGALAPDCRPERLPATQPAC